MIAVRLHGPQNSTIKPRVLHVRWPFTWSLREAEQIVRIRPDIRVGEYFVRVHRSDATLIGMRQRRDIKGVVACCERGLDIPYLSGS